jgi:hypothetical protein
MTSCNPLSFNRRFWETYRLLLQGLRNKFSKKPASRQVFPPKHRLKINGIHGVLSQKIILFITTAVKTSSPSTCNLYEIPNLRLFVYKLVPSERCVYHLTLYTQNYCYRILILHVVWPGYGEFNLLLGVIVAFTYETLNVRELTFHTVIQCLQNLETRDKSLLIFVWILINCCWKGCDLFWDFILELVQREINGHSNRPKLLSGS